MNREKWMQTFGIGLTGGIATGKSTVVAILREIGVLVVDADMLARKVVEPGSKAILQLAHEFGADFLLPSGELHRAKVREQILVDSGLRKKLERILHPAIQQQLWVELEKANIIGKPVLWVYDAALLFETHSQGRFREVWVTKCSREVQIARVSSRDHISVNQATHLLQAQWSTEEKCKRASWVIDTEVPLAALQEKVHQKWKQINDGMI